MRHPKALDLPAVDASRTLSRRNLLRASVALPFALRFGAAAGVGLALTPERADADEPATPATTEGPYFKTKSPERCRIREKDSAGTSLVVTGHVLTTKGAPVEAALVDVWQADGDGVYDNDGFRFRGHQFTAKDGSYRLETVVPGYYPGRTRHIHVKVQAPGQRVLTTQLFFPNDPRNRDDRIYASALRMGIGDAPGKDAGKIGSFDFVVVG
jgi:hypothetical protein